MERFVSADEFTNAMAFAVAKRGPDYVYSEEICRYVDGPVSCLIGEALLHIGVPHDLLFENEGTAAGVVMGPGYLYDTQGRDLVFDFGIRSGAEQAQKTQDCHESWGRAYAYYRSRISEVK